LRNPFAQPGFRLRLNPGYAVADAIRRWPA
jgi:hypothetical protein